MTSMWKKEEQQIYQSIIERVCPEGIMPYMGQLLERAGKTFGNDVALLGRQRPLTYARLLSASRFAAAQLQKLGARPGTRVIVFLENSFEFYIFYWAVLLCGATVVPVNTYLHERELTHIINDCQPVLIVSVGELKARIGNIMLGGQLTATPILFDALAVEWQMLLQGHDAPPVAVGSLPSADDVTALLYTSGTTGVPKGVMLTSRNMITNAIQAQARLSLVTTEKERFFAVLPLFHAFAQNVCVWLPVISGASAVVVPKIERSAILEGLKKEPTIFLGFPALYGLLCLMRNAPLDGIKLFVSGADALPDKIRAAFALIYGRKICSGYGLTEASPALSIHYQNDDVPTNAVGRPLVGVDLEIRDDAGAMVPRGDVGTLWVRGQNIMAGYYNAPEATAAILQNGWLNTGDLAYLSDRGEIVLTGRSKDLIIHKGLNIYPQEIENILMRHPAVFKAAVVGRDEVSTGQIPVAYVALKARTSSVEQDLRSLCAQHLAAYKIPRTFVCLDDLPMSPTGKIDKKKLQTLY